MSQELHLHFPDPAHVIVSLDNPLTQALPFTPPLGAAELDEDALCEELDVDDSMIILATLRGIADPESLQRVGDNYSGAQRAPQTVTD